MTADHRAPVRLGLRNRLAGLWLRSINPFARRMIPAGIPTGAPNVLLTVPGRRTGMPRTVPLGIVVLDDRTFVQASFGEAGHRSRLLGALLGRQFRPPIGVLWRIHVRIDDTAEEYVAEARRHPLFELRPLTEAADVAPIALGAE